ncbi:MULTISPECIES: bifunctional phosphopantothenoylcysteine decarboxylase/phosphopantothenate--cysteine ligase CoaBC [unclassified Lacticaseibacillus]|uniref:bifunctional phosphopantothenoylcysteine decarboxylase/phosphopantothenate--cysteine ligase CoaBC n=1 Tax=unclassified Lacticaseibacillus TaxID=2759744 RepID=UPI0019422E2F|nr:MULTISPECIES: bifunctional phosphopantothenoylcysteine decarboxylase/phosphopantothenate--cysteine ligase CoaBC [unclassified Lacticaseibacillus]
MAKKIGVFITGGIAAYKTPNLVRLLIKAGFEVRVAVTPAATNFVTVQSLATVSKHAVLTDDAEFAAPEHVAHVELARWMDLALVVPATANTLAKMAAGMADNVVTTTLLAFSGLKLVVPAMNDQMWANPQTQANVAHLQDMGVQVLPPATGFLAEGYTGQGRMPDEAVITMFAALATSDQYLRGVKVLVTAGGTRERLDPVRYLTNDSSGKMGTALANAAAAAGAKVTLITTAHQVTLPAVEVEKVDTAEQMNAEVQARFAQTDIVLMAAAVADYRPREVASSKLKKTGEQGLTLDLVQNPDILAALGASKTHQFVAGFAAETNDLLKNAQAKLARKRADMLIANRVGNGLGFNRDDNVVTLLQPGQAPIELAQGPKLELAQQILRRIQEVRA